MKDARIRNKFAKKEIARIDHNPDVHKFAHIDEDEPVHSSPEEKEDLKEELGPFGERALYGPDIDTIPASMITLHDRGVRGSVLEKAIERGNTSAETENTALAPLEKDQTDGPPELHAI